MFCFPLPLDTLSFVLSSYHLMEEDWCRRRSVRCRSRFRRQVGLDSKYLLSPLWMLGFGELKTLPASCTVAGEHIDDARGAQCYLSRMLRAVMLFFSWLSLAFGLLRTISLYSGKDFRPAVTRWAACVQCCVLSSKLWSTRHACMRFLFY